MSGTVQDSPVGAPGAPERERRWRPGRRRTLGATAALLVVIAMSIAIAVSDPFGGSSKASTGVTDNSTTTSLATVRHGTLSSQVDASGTLGYLAQPNGSPYQVVNQASGAFTALPTDGQVVGCGRVLYRVANNPVALLCGSTPAYRSLSDGDSGPDVRELNANLVRLGYATREELDASSNYFSAETAYALERLQAKLGVDQTGSLDLGQAVFLPGPLRISSTTATLGSLAHPDAPVAQATSTSRQVQVNLDASEQSSVKAGEKALVTLPDNQTTPGRVTRIGTVASSSGSGAGSSSGAGSGSSSATIPIYINLKHPGAAAGLDQAPVQVQITTAGVRNALIVPVDALLAEPGGAYAVETVAARGVHHLVPVKVGLFDDADGLVQVSGQGLAAGEQVAVPST
jgi:peptidoglycan hydrolase-like protein with peptidoglycan-binding domain